MASFIKMAACEGRRPKHLSSLRCFPRSDLIARLLGDRHVARFVVAPDGFGKSSLASGYAETVFAFRHVLWINGKSPCFLRDLDLGSIASGVTAVDAQAALVVMDDVPPLAPERAALLSAQIDTLLAHGCEVLVCCSPSCDAFAALQRDRLKLDPADLLLASADAASSSDSEAADAPHARIAGLQRGSGLSSRAFLDGITREDLPSELLLSLMIMLSLREGCLDEVSAFGACGSETLELLAYQYPFLGIDERAGVFKTPWFEPDDIAHAFLPKLDSVAQRSNFSSRSDLACGIADVLLGRFEGKRACGVVASLCPRADKTSWLERRCVALAKQACILPASDLSRCSGKDSRGSSSLLDANDAWRYAALGDFESARRHARRAASSKSESPQVMGLLVLLRHGTARERSRAQTQLEGWQSMPLSQKEEGGLGHACWTRPLASMSNLADLPAEDARRRWADWSRGEADPDALSIAALWLFEDACARAEGRDVREGERAAAVVGSAALTGAADALLLTAAARHVAQRLELAGDDHPDAFASMACLAWTGLRRAEALCGACDPLTDPAAQQHAREIEASVFSQRRELERRGREKSRRRQEYAATHPDSFLDGRYAPADASGNPREPMLCVKLFGGVEVRIGDRLVDPKLLRRQKVKTLLALLVLNRGRDVSRDRLVAIMWPDANLESARKNFYTIWSLLRTALALPDGSCPYLVRQQNVCRIEPSLLRSDITEFDEVCRTLMFGSMETDGWERLSTEVDEHYLDDLMPGERGTETIERMRKECRTRLVDALVAAARRLVDAGRIQESLWFARAALKRDKTREDAYTVLMRVQVAAGQRAAALDTYFECRRFLAEQLGIDPSLETMAIYHGIIESEEGLL